MKTALVTPFLSHLPLHPGSYLGYGAATLGDEHDIDVMDLNAEIYFKNKDQLKEVLLNIENKKVVFDNLDIYPFYSQLLGNVEKEYDKISWKDYHTIFITTPSWFVTVPTEDILQLSNLIRRKSRHCKIVFFCNSLGSWTDEHNLRKNHVSLSHLNDLGDLNPDNRPVNYDCLPEPEYKSREKYIFNLLPFRLKHGCIWGKCKFCSLARGWNSGYLERSAKQVIQELEGLLDKYNPAMLVCRDNSINGSNLLEFCEHFKEFNKPWLGMGRADLSNKEIKSLHRAGCKFIYFGLESGSDKVLNDLAKGIDSKQMSCFIKTLYDHNIMPAPSVFVGSPGETEDDFEKTVRFIIDHRGYLDIINLYPLRITPASSFALMGRESNRNTLTRLKKLIGICEDIGIKVCVGEQSAEYALIRKVYPDELNY